MALLDTTRRGFLRRMGIGIGGLGLAGVACNGTSANEELGEYKRTQDARKAADAAAATQAQAQHDVQHTGGGSGVVVQAQPSGHSAAEMDAAHEKGVKYFLANAKDMTSNALPFEMDGNVKVFRVTTKEVDWEIRPGEVKKAFTYNGVLPGPEIRVTEGDTVRVILTNELPESTSIHWHGIITPNKMDGVPFVTQPPVKTGESFTYEFVVKPAGTHMYHSHHNAMEQVGKGLLGAFIVEPKNRASRPAFDKEYTMVLNDTLLSFTLNGKSFPATGLLTAKVGQKVLVRYINEGLMNHPMHLHGMPMQIVAKDGYLLANPYMCDTQDIAPGDRYEAIIECTEPGAWAFHCHTLSHAESPDGMFGLVTVLVVS
jgi:FtsP/CotA-like multicopper oxidase with cupredoxin domain